MPIEENYKTYEQKIKTKKIKNTLIVVLLLLPVLVLILFPYFIMLSTSLRTLQECVVFPPKWFPSKIIWRNYIDIFQKIPLGRFFSNSFLVGIGATFICLISALPAAFILVRYRLRFRSAILFLILITQFIAPAIMIIALFKMVLRIKLMDTHLALIITDAAFFLPFSTWLLLGFLKTVPGSIFEAATIDGASDIRTMYKIALPIIKPGLITAIIFTFIEVWNEFLFALIFLTSYKKRVLTIGIFAFSARNKFQWNYLLAAALLSAIPVIILFLLLQKYLIKGLTAGAIKE